MLTNESKLCADDTKKLHPSRTNICLKFIDLTVHWKYIYKNLINYLLIDKWLSNFIQFINVKISNVEHCPCPPKQLWKRTKEHACMFVNLMINDSTSRSVNILEDWNIAWGRKTPSTILHHQHETHAYFQKTKCKHIASY